MSITLGYLAALAIAASGLAALALSMDKHHRQALISAMPMRRGWALRAAGWIALAASAALCMRIGGAGVGLAGWCGLLTVAGTAIALCMTYRPRRIVPASLVLMVVGACGAAAALLGT